jgi:hypothetical protein
MYNRWNPYSEEVKSIPSVYWIIAFNFIQVKSSQDWENNMLPHAELIGQLTHPEIYTEYRKFVDKKKKEDSLKKGESYYKETRNGFSGGGSSNAHYDPTIGLVDEEGRVIVPKDEYEQMTGIAGIAVSY